jgi:hypothetical protein
MKAPTLRQAINLSLIKWKILSMKTWMVGRDEVRNHPKLKGLIQNCGFCERSTIRSGKSINDWQACNICEFGNLAGICEATKDSLHAQYVDAHFTDEVEIGKKIYALLLKMKADLPKYNRKPKTNG